MIDSTRLVVLVDGSSYLFRAFHGLPPLSTRDGYPTGALHGVIKMLTKLYDDYQPCYLGVVFDAKGKTFRHDIFPMYKSHRPPVPEDLVRQINPLFQLIQALGFALIIEPNVEADDVIGTLAKQALEDNYQVVISSGDKDMAQLLTHADITLLDTMKNETTTQADVARRFKVDALRADQVVDFLALVGDASDNIPGVKNVGPKTAAKWLEKYEHIENIIANADSIAGKVGENLRTGIDQLRLSYVLATIRCDVALNTTIADLTPQSPNKYKLAALCDTYELLNIKAQYLGRSTVSEIAAPQVTDYHVIDNMIAFYKLIARITEAKQFAIDTETDSLNYMQANLVGISIALEVGQAYYLPLAHQFTANLPRDEVLTALRPLLMDASIKKIGQNFKYDAHIFQRYGIEVLNNVADTMLMSYCYNSTATRHNMDDLADYYLNYQTTTFEDIAGKGAKQLTFDKISVDIASAYACEDADITYRLYNFFTKHLNETPALETLYTTIEQPLSAVLCRMEARGVRIDSAQLQAQSSAIAKTLSSLEDEAYQLAGMVFNLGSPKQLQEILFSQLQLPIIHKTSKGQPSTNEEVLEELAVIHNAALPRVILAHRRLTKLKSTYTDKLPELVDVHTGRIHTSYHQAVTSTGRLSSSEPNLQNIPIRSDEGRKIRQAFVAAPGYKILAADYSQIELRIMAHLSEDEGLLQAFMMGKDIHAATASEIFSTDLAAVTANQRRSAKSINFGLIYGMSAFGLARQLGITRAQASAYIDTYFARYPKVREYMESVRHIARKNGYVQTLLGRRLYLADITSKNAQRRNAAERLAINAPMQGSAADIIKCAMIALDNVYKNDLRCQLIMQVHDELVFEIRADCIADIQQDIEQKMSQALKLRIPLEVSIGVGDNWDEAHG